MFLRCMGKNVEIDPTIFPNNKKHIFKQFSITRVESFSNQTFFNTISNLLFVKISTELVESNYLFLEFMFFGFFSNIVSLLFSFIHSFSANFTLK